MRVAINEIGVTEIHGIRNNPRIITYHTSTGNFKDDETAWCSSFANWTVNQVDVDGTGSALARSWLSWGHGLNSYKYGAITVVNKKGTGNYHVGFAAGSSKNYITILGGNQGRPGQVKYSNFNFSNYNIYFRMP